MHAGLLPLPLAVSHDAGAGLSRWRAPRGRAAPCLSARRARWAPRWERRQRAKPGGIAQLQALQPAAASIAENSFNPRPFSAHLMGDRTRGL